MILVRARLGEKAPRSFGVYARLRMADPIYSHAACKHATCDAGHSSIPPACLRCRQTNSYNCVPSVWESTGRRVWPQSETTCSVWCCVVGEVGWRWRGVRYVDKEEAVHGVGHMCRGQSMPTVLQDGLVMRLACLEAWCNAQQMLCQLF
eukprot:364463-Chlamydomonas_euryale.AAC.12